MAVQDQRAGALNEPTQIEELVESQDAAGEPTKTYNRVANEFAAVRSVGSPESFVSDRPLGTKLRSFTYRYLSWLTVRHRIVWRGENYNILSIADVGRNHFLEVLAELKE